MHDRVLAMENPGIRVRPLDPRARLIAGDNSGGAQNGFRLLGLSPLRTMLVYKQLWTVERTFRTTKSLFETRPTPGLDPGAIRGHVA